MYIIEPLKSQDSFGELRSTITSWSVIESAVYYQKTQLNLPVIPLNEHISNAILPSGIL